MEIIKALWFRNIKLFVRNRVQLILVIVMPFFFLYVLNSIFKNDYITDPVNYMLPGLVIITVFQTALSIAASTIDDIVSGYMKEVLVSPVKRIQIAAGQIFASTTIATLQGILIMLVGYFIGLRYSSILTPIAVIAFMILAGFVFSAFGLFLATVVKSSQTFQIVSVAVTTPFTFLCGAYFPLDILPKPMQIVSYFNPMTYTTAFFRALSLEKLSLSSEQLLTEQLAFKIGNFIVTPSISLLIVLIFGLIFFTLSSIAFAKVDFSRLNRSGNYKDIFQQ